MAIKKPEAPKTMTWPGDDEGEIALRQKREQEHQESEKKRREAEAARVETNDDKE